MVVGSPQWLALHRVWRNPQVLLPKVIRWEKYTNDPDNGGVRRQDSLQHSHSLSILGSMMKFYLRQYLKAVDWDFLHDAFLLHDQGEGELGRDTVYIDKTVQGDVDEWEAFWVLTEPLPADLRERLNQAFLLQFCLDEDKLAAFPPDAQETMLHLSSHYEMEALIFEAVERYDYMLYAQEQYHERGNKRILVQTMRHQIRHLNRLARELPGFDKVFWTPEVRDWHVEFVAEHDGQWLEKRGVVAVPEALPATR